jgi:hypothetical protein
MDLRGIGRALRRQWALALVIAIVTVGVAVWSVGRVETKYQGRASLLFVSSPLTADNQGDPISVNPFSLSGNAERVASSAMLALSRSPGFVDEIREAGAGGEVRFRRSSDAILDVKSTAVTPADAIGSLDTAVTIVREQLEAQQAAAGAPPGSYMKIETLAHSDQALALEGNPTRAVGAIVLVGVVVAIAAVVALDAAAPDALRRGGAGIRRGVRTLAGGPKNQPPHPPYADPSNGAPTRAPTPSREPAQTREPAPVPPANRNGIGNREARRRAARAGKGNGSAAPPLPARGEPRSQSGSRPS